MDSRASISIRGGAIAAIAAVALAALTVIAPAPAAATAQPAQPATTTMTTTPGPSPAVSPADGFLLRKGYQDAAGTIHGFLRDGKGRYHTIDVPGAAATGAFDINDRRQIVGSSEPPTGNRATLGQPAAHTGDQLLRAP